MFGLSGCVESSTFYYPSREPFVTPQGYENVAIRTGDGLTLHGWFLRAPTASALSPAPAVLHVHGNAGNVSSHVAFSEFLPAAGVSVLIFDYRGYGRSDACQRITRDALLEDTRAAWDYLLARQDVDRARVGVYAVSVGAAPGLALAAERSEVRAVAEVSGFATWRSIAAAHMPVLGPLLIAGGMDPEDLVRRLGDRPLLIVHGGQDAIVPMEHARRIEAAAREAGVPVELAIDPLGDHNEYVIENERLQREIAAFFREALLADSGP